MCRLFVGSKAHDITPVRNVFRRTGLFVRSIASRDVEFRTSENFFIIRVVIFISTSRNIRRISKIILVRVLLAPSESLFGGIEACRRVRGIKRLVNTRSHSHHCSKVKRTRSTFTDNIKFGVILSRHHIARESKRC